MTSFIQHLIDAGWSVHPAWTEHGWLEVDTVQDLHRYHEMAQAKVLDRLCRLTPVSVVRASVDWEADLA